ncbi:MAG TPA: glycosyltransferase N-terminal domain-containing protein [Opitutaceae bacterium]|nr:glycosyltransferase N-terminal domain-containing protein [Opitutaceae bacterium]
MLWFYRLIFAPALVALAPGYLWRMRRRGGYGRNFSQRFGAVPSLPPRKKSVRRVWLQAVSVGEMLAIGPLLEALHADGVEVYLTTTTSTGYRLACDRYLGLAIGVGYFPLDWWPFAARAWRGIAPDLAIITEGERWPEHLRQAAKRGVPVLCINARLSDRSYARMKRFPAGARLMLGGVTRLLPCSRQDEARLRELGVPAEKIFTTGNIKLDVQIAPLTDAERAQLRRELGLLEGLVLLGSSTWPGEEEALLAAWRGARESGLRCSLLIVPRHAERRGEIERLLGASGVRFHLRSHGAAAGEIDVAVGDTTGELRRLTQLADLVFVGKSLPPHAEGQTPVEAAALAKPILFGPGMSNFRLIARDLVARGAAIEVADAAALARETARLLRDAAARTALAEAAAAWRRENAGALARTLTIIREELARLQP